MEGRCGIARLQPQLGHKSVARIALCASWLPSLQHGRTLDI
jgi:hypothetical protein